MSTHNPFADLSLARWRSLIRTRESAVEIVERSISLAVTAQYCDNPACSCEDVTFSFREELPPRRRAAMAFDVSVDLAGEAEALIKALGDDAERIAHAVAVGLRGPGRVAVRQALREHRAQLRRIPATIAGYAQRGDMVPYAHIAAGGVEADDHYVAWLDEFDDEQDRPWSVIDHVCANPACACGAMSLHFYEDDRGAPGARFDAYVKLGEAGAELSDFHGISRAEAEEVYAEWESTTPFDRDVLKERYERVRALAREGLAAIASPTRRTPVRAAAVPAPMSRRAPCPCGSGKRYKNCCGADAR